MKFVYKKILSFLRPAGFWFLPVSILIILCACAEKKETRIDARNIDPVDGSFDYRFIFRDELGREAREKNKHNEDF